MAYLDYNGLSYFKQKNDALYAKATDLSNLSDVVAQKANIDGSYESMTVGNAEQLLSSVGITDETPYNLRTSGGSVDIGDREELNAVVGGTVVWNQLQRFGTGTEQSAGVTYTKNSDGSITCSGTSTGDSHVNIGSTLTGLLNHVLYICGCPKGGSTSTYYFRDGYNGNASDRDIGNGKIIKGRSNYIGQIVFWRGVDATGLVFRPQMFDLTKMFGSTIADYIYALEQSSAGSGIAYFRKLFPKPYYAYNSGELTSAQTSAHKMVGFNAYNPTTGTAKVVGGNRYQITGAYTSLSLDGTTITPDANGKFTPSANGTLTVTGGNSTTTCVHLVWDGERDGEYEPYEAHEYALDDVELRGILKLDASNNLYADGDRYLPDGTVERIRHRVTIDGTNLGVTTVSSSKGVYYAVVVLPVAAIKTSSTVKSIVNDGGYEEATGDVVGHIYVASANGLSLVVEFMDQTLTTKELANTFFASHPLTVEYTMQTPTTETADPYQQTQIVDDFGTEEFVDAAVEAGERDVAIPVGNETVYKPNLRAKLEMAPDSPSNGDGLYVVQQISGENTYVPLIVPNEIPDAPTTDGTYVLKATVSDGTATYSWVSDS